MKTKNDIFKRIAVYGFSAALLFSLPACNGGGEAVEEEDGLVENGAVTEMDEIEEETEFTEVNNEGYYDTWDADRSGGLTEEEFRTRWAEDLVESDYEENAFGEWDANDDANLDENEFRGGLWGYYDKDDNSSLNEEEFAGLGSSYYNKRWNTDNTDGISEGEFRQGWETNVGDRPFNETYFGEWDANDDNLLDENELNTGMFGVWDENDNNMVEQNEYESYYTL